MVGAVVRQAVHDAGCRGVVLLDDASPEAGLAGAWCAEALGAEAVTLARAPEPTEAVALRFRIGAEGPTPAPERLVEEAHRFYGRVVALARGALLAHPANKTALLLAGAVPCEPLLPLGDLYASQVQALTGRWSAPAAVRDLAAAAGGIERLDAALMRLFEERRGTEEAFGELPRAAAASVLRALEAGRFSRRRIGVVPKLGARTLGIDLFA